MSVLKGLFGFLIAALTVFGAGPQSPAVAANSPQACSKFVLHGFVEDSAGNRDPIGDDVDKKANSKQLLPGNTFVDKYQASIRNGVCNLGALQQSYKGPVLVCFSEHYLDGCPVGQVIGVPDSMQDSEFVSLNEHYDSKTGVVLNSSGADNFVAGKLTRSQGSDLPVIDGIIYKHGDVVKVHLSLGRRFESIEAANAEFHRLCSAVVHQHALFPNDDPDGATRATRPLASPEEINYWKAKADSLIGSE